MALNLVTGVPGASKTAYVVTQLDSIERQNKINLQKNKLIFQYNEKLFKKYEDDFAYYEIEVGSGHELKNEMEFLPDNYFSFLGEDFDDLRPDYYFLRSIRYNEIIERIEDREGEQGFKRFQPVRTIYSNIKALKIDYVRANVYDWRNCPDGSIIVIDEVQLVEPYSNTKVKDEIVMELTTHRHRGFDFYFITQAPSLLHPTIKELIGCHFHITRPYGRTPKIYRFGSCRQYPNTLVNKLNCEAKFDFKPQQRIFKLYKSTTIDTHKPRYPKGLIGWALFILAACCLFLYSCSGSSKSSLSPFKKDEVKEENKVINPGNIPPSITDIKHESASTEPIDLQKDELKRVAMIIESSNDCYAKNSYGNIIEMTEEQCRFLSQKNSRIPLSKLKRQVEQQPMVTESSTSSINENVIHGT
ncbi:zonular occludens toxin domain-containing protein [Acinetobacter baumannii]|nr:zonular occludens toxin domain-containing protein [Acinetobacter baumannii]MDC5634307.1 zonular occludens toxin domain-containing protein [Acinetobacter baumannii]